MKTQFLILSMLLFSVLIPATGRTQILINIDSPSGQNLPIAIADLKPLEGGPDATFAPYQKILERDLKLTGYFKILSRDTFLEGSNSGITIEETNFDLWKKSGADALIKGGYRLKNGRYYLELRLYDVQQKQLILGKKFTFEKNDLPRVVHAFVDEVLQKLTGEKGVFATTKILALSYEGKRNKEVFLMNPDGSGLQQLTQHRSITLSADWSNDGDLIGYTSYAAGNPDFYLMERASRKTRKLIAFPGLNFGVAFSPKSEMFALAVSDDKEPEIKLFNFKGKVLRTLTQNRWADMEPTFSPDGKNIAFVSDQSGQPHVWRMSVDGGEPTRLTFQGYHNVNPAWSPRGDKIAFCGRDQGYFDIFVMNPDGSNIERLTMDAGNNESPSWSPDGRLIAFTSSRMGKEQIFVMDARGKTQIQITPSTAKFSSPSWSPELRDLKD